MPIDSTADLLFKIGANSDDAESNIQRFRSILSKDLGTMGQDFEDWSKKTFGAMDSAAAIGMAGAAALATAIVAGATAAVHCSDQYERYVEGIAKASKVTGIAVEDVSRLKFTAEATGTSFDSLQTGLVRFTSNVVAAARGSEQQLAAFERLGISQKDLKAGEQNLLPLLQELAEHFSNLKNKTDRAAEARDLFGRDGTKWLSVLALGRDGLKKMADEADRLGLTIHKTDVLLVHQVETTKAYSQAVRDAIAVAFGRKSTSPLLDFQVGLTSLFQTLEHGPKLSFFQDWAKNARAVWDAGKALNEARERLGDKPLQPAADKTEKTKENYDGLSEVLERVNSELASFGSEEEQAEQKLQHLMFEMDKAKAKLGEKQAKGELEKGVYARQIAVWDEFAQKMVQLHDELTNAIAQRRNRAGNEAEADLRQRLMREGEQTREAKEAEWNAEMDGLLNKYRGEKDLRTEEEHELENLVAQLRQAGLDKIARAEDEAAQKATEDLQKRLAERGARSLSAEHEQWDAEMNALRESYAKKLQLTAENEALLAQIRAAGHAKIDAAAKSAFDSEMARLQEEAQRIGAAHMLSEDRIAAQYQADVAKYAAAEEKKSLALATSEAQRAQIMAQFAAVRKALYTKEQGDLQQLENSQGWQGVFGAKFSQMIRGNEGLSKEWASSQNQSQMMVRITLEGLKEVGQQTFQHLADGMGANIASALVYEKSIGQAMNAMLKSTLESLASQALSYAIYCTALGFMRLAQYDPGSASEAFTAAAIWGTVGVAAGVAGRAVPSPQQGGGAGTQGATAPGGGSSATQTAPGGTAASGGSHVTLNVYGHVVGTSGVGELCSLLSDAVLNKDHTLTASNTKSGVQVTR